MIHTGLPCLECGQAIVRKKRNNTTDLLMFCCGSCRGRWVGKQRGNRHLLDGRYGAVR